MKIDVTGQIKINAPAEKVWHIVAHEFADIGKWATAIPASSAVSTPPQFGDAPVAGRVCETAVSGFSAIQEQFTYYDEQAMKFGYRAINGNPAFLKNAENNWQVNTVGFNQSEVTIRGLVELKSFPGVLVAPFMRIQLRRLGDQTIEELKYYIENDQPHPRKVKALQK